MNNMNDEVNEVAVIENHLIIVKPYTFTYPFVKDDAGRSQSKRPRQRNDCTVRALTIACQIPYDEMYDFLADKGRKSWKGFNLKWLEDGMSFFGHRVEKTTFQAVKGQKRMNPKTFSEQFTKGRYVVKVAKHVFAFVDGVSHDTFQERDDRCIYVAWRFVPESA